MNETTVQQKKRELTEHYEIANQKIMNETTVQQKKRELIAHYEIARVLERELVIAQCEAQIKAGNIFGIVTRKDWAGQNISRWFDRTKNCWCLGDLETLTATNTGTAKYIEKLWNN